MTTNTTETASVDLGHYFSVLRRRAGIIVLFTVAGLLAGIAYLALADRAVTATTTVNVNVIASDPFSNPRSAADLLDPETEMQLATSSAVLRQVAERLEDPIPVSRLRSRMKATLINDATVMRIAYTSDDRAEAETTADAIAQAYLAFRNVQAQNRAQATVDQLNQRRDDLREDLLRLNTIIRDAQPGSNRAVQAETDRQLVNIELDRLSGQISAFLGLDTTGGVILTAADQNATSVAPSRGLALVSGTLAGFLLGLVAAFVLHGLDRRIRDGHDVRRAGGGQVLGELPDSEGAVPASDREAEVVRSVRELLFATLSSQTPVVAVADVSATGGGGDVPVNLALAIAETGRRVDLVMADTTPEAVRGLAETLQLQPVPGGSADRLSRGELTMVAPGRRTADLEQLAAGRGDVVTVVAVPHGAAHSSLLAAGRLGHAVVLVVSKGGTGKDQIRAVAEQLSVVQARVHGTVLVSRKRRPAPQLTR